MDPVGEGSPQVVVGVGPAVGAFGGFGERPATQWAAAEAEHEGERKPPHRRHVVRLASGADQADGTSERGHIERNCIALLSGAEPASPDWLGRHAVNPAINSSGLWNVNHVHEQYRLENLDRLEEHLVALPTTRRTAHTEAR